MKFLANSPFVSCLLTSKNHGILRIPERSFDYILGLLNEQYIAHKCQFDQLSIFFIRLFGIVIRDLFDFGNVKQSRSGFDRLAKTFQNRAKEMGRKEISVETHTNRFHMESAMFNTFRAHYCDTF